MNLVDSRQPRFGQAVTGLILLGAFVADWKPAIPVIAGILGAAALLGGRGSLYALIFRGLKSLVRLGPPRELEEAAPPRFANAVGFAFLVAATGLTAVGLGALAWTLALIVAALALLAASTGFCVGCELYVLLRRLATGGRVSRRLTTTPGRVPMETP